MRSLLEIKTPVRSAARSYILTSPESSNVGILEVRLIRGLMWAGLSWPT